jgi:hypothetical protein
MNLLQDILTYIRRIIKSPSNSSITDNLLIDYVNRFLLMDVDARMQLFDYKTKYQFQTVPGVDQYNMPLYAVQTEPGAQTIASFPIYQGFLAPAFVNGIQVPFYTQKNAFYNIWPNYVTNSPAIAVGNGSSGPYTLSLPFVPNINTTVNVVPPGLLRGHVDITGIISSGGAPTDPIIGNTLNTSVPMTSIYSGVYFTSTGTDGSNIIVQDSGQFLGGPGGNINYGLLMSPGVAPGGGVSLPNGGLLPTPYATTQNTINYNTGIATNVYFPAVIPAGQNIHGQGYFYEPGLPRAILFYNNCLVLRNPPDTQYLVEIDAYLSPAAFLNSANAIPFGYMAEYIARGAARKILSDTGDVEQFMFYEPFFKEQELLVWKRSQRQWTANRTETIYSNTGFGNGFATNGLYGSGAN